MLGSTDFSSVQRFECESVTNLFIFLFLLLLLAALKVKLMMRRPYTQLVDQGIMPRK